MAYQQNTPAVKSLNKLMLALVFLMMAIDITQADPQSNFPINSQVPPVARVDQQFDFIFSADTFVDDDVLSYFLSGAPSWLTFDPATRHFGGTPRQSDTGPAAFNLTATDSNGSTTVPVTFVVMDTPGPQLAPFEPSVLSAGSFSGPGAVLLAPGANVAISVKPSAFINTDANTQYYSVCGDNTPLPSWITFHPSTLSFDGTVLPASSPSELPLHYTLHVVATDVPGFAAAVFKIPITIDLHSLQFNSERVNINITNGQAFSYTDLKNDLTLDGQAFDLHLITSVEANFPTWLVIDSATLDISGVSPHGFSVQLFWVSIQDTYGDETNTTVMVWANTGSHILGLKIPSIHASCGESFSYTFPAHTFATDNVETSIDFGNCSWWLWYYPSNFTVTGVVPGDWPLETFYVNLTASKDSQSVWEEIPITITNATGPTNTTTPLPTGSPGSTGSNPDQSISNSNLNRTAIIASLVTALGLAAIIIAFVFRQDCVRKRGPLILVEKDSPKLDDTKQKGKASPTDSIWERYRIQSPERSPFQLSDDWYGYSRNSPEALTNHEFAAPRKGSSAPSSIRSSIVQKVFSKKRRAMPLATVYDGGFGHGSVAIRPGSPNTDPRPKHVPIRVPSQAHLLISDFAERNISLNDSFETATSSSELGQRSSLHNDNQRAFQRGNYLSQTPRKMNNPFSIRQVMKSPTPSEMPSPDLNSSPRSKFRSFVHDRATQHKTSGLFGSGSTQRNTEQGSILPTRQASLNTGSYLRTSNAFRPARTSSRLGRFTPAKDWTTGTRATMSRQRFSQRSFRDSLYTSGSNTDSDWTDVENFNKPKNAEAATIFRTETPEAREDKTDDSDKDNVASPDDSPLEYAPAARARLRTSRQRPVSIEQSDLILEHEHQPSYSLRGDLAFP